MSEPSLIEFPCDFPIKIMGAAGDSFLPAMAAIVVRHAPDFKVDTIQIRPSKAGNYLALTCTVRAHSQAQLDGLYRELSSHPMVKVAL